MTTHIKDYRVEVRIKNGYMLAAMQRAGISTAAELSRLCGVSQGRIGDLLNLRRSFVRANGEWTSTVIKIADALRSLPEDLVPPQHIDKALAKNVAVFDADLGEVESMFLEQRVTDPLKLIEQTDFTTALNEVLLNRLTDRERQVITLRFGLDDGEPKELEAIGDVLKRSRERVRQIEAKALRKLKTWASYRNNGEREAQLREVVLSGHHHKLHPRVDTSQGG